MGFAYLKSLVVVSAAFAAGVGCASHMNEGGKGQAMGAGVVTGYVIPAGARVPGKGAEVRVKLVDATVSGKEQVVATDSKTIKDGPPWAFRLDAGSVKPDHVYEVWAEVTQGKGKMEQKWRQTKAMAVLTGGTPSYVEVTVVPQ